jgi:hypothetical protein
LDKEEVPRRLPAIIEHFYNAIKPIVGRQIAKDPLG